MSRSHAGRRVRVSDATLLLDLRQCRRHGGRDGRKEARACEPRRERGTLLGTARRGRELRNCYRHRLCALSCRSGDRRRRGRMAGKRGARGSGTLQDARGRRATQSHVGGAHTLGSAGALVAEGDAWKADRHDPGCYSGDPAEGERVVAPIKTFGNPVGDVLVRRPYAQLQSMLDATQPKGKRYYWKSE